MTPCSKVPNFKENFHFPTASTADPTNTTDKDVDHGAANDQEDDLEPEKHLPEESHERTINLKRWVPLPQAIADKKPEPKYLADRRPGLPPLYGHRAATYTNAANATGYAPNISSTFLSNFNPNVNTGDVVVGTVTVPVDRVATASGYRVQADGTTVPMGPGMPFGTTTGSSGAAGPGPGEAKRRPPPPPPKRRKKGGPGRSKKKVEVAQEQKKGDDVVALQGAGTQVAGDSASGVSAPAPAQPTAPATSHAQSADTGTAQGSIDIEMTEADLEGEDSGSLSGDDEGSEEGEIDDVGAAAPPVPTPAITIDPALQASPAPGPAFSPPPTAMPTTTTSPPVPTVPTVPTPSAPAPTTSVVSVPVVAASVTFPIQPPSPDLLGNLESEIQGMEDAGGRRGDETEEK